MTEQELQNARVRILMMVIVVTMAVLATIIVMGMRGTL